MAATITGQRLTELTFLQVGATGTRLFAVSQNGTLAYQMTLSGLNDTLTGLFLNNTYQPKIEDWRFVHKTGAESITGIKTFANAPIISGVRDLNSDLAVDINEKNLIGGWTLENSPIVTEATIENTFDNRYVNVTGAENVSGHKTFFDNVSISGTGFRLVCPDDGVSVVVTVRKIGEGNYTFDLSGIGL